jgi:hypothetical protein
MVLPCGNWCSGKQSNDNLTIDIVLSDKLSFVIHLRILCLYAMRQRLTPVILTTQEAAIRRIVLWSQHGQIGQIVRETLSWKAHHKYRAGGVAQGEGPEFKPQNHKK